MFRLDKAETYPMTRGTVLTFLDLTPSPTERPLDPKRVEHLRKKAENGWLVTFHWARARLGDEFYRVNGQHSSAMLADLEPLPEGLSVHLDEYVVENERDLVLLFRQFDDRKSGRSSADVAGAYQGLEPALRDVSRSVGKLGIQAVNWYRRYQEKVHTLGGDEQYDLFHEERLHSFLKWLNELFSIKTPELRQVPVVAAMHWSFETSEEEARHFWEEVARGGREFEEQAPSTVLDEWLKTVKEEKQDVKPGEFYNACTYAWKAYRKGISIRDIKYRKPTPTAA